MSGYLPNLIEIAPKHAGALMGISNTVASLPGIVGNVSADCWWPAFRFTSCCFCNVNHDVQVLSGWLLDTTGTWSMLFTVPVLLAVGGLLVFLKWGEGCVVID